MNNNIEFDLICLKAPAPLKAINEISTYEQPSKYIVSSTQYDDSYNIPVLTAGQTFVLGYTDETENIYPASKENPVIIFDDFTGAFKWADFPFKVKSSAMKIIKAKEDTVLIRYLYHMMGKINFSSDEHKRLWLSKYSLFEIPVPPLPVQEKIVEVLDTFTEYEAELEAELKARRKQYEFYRNLLLDFSGENLDKHPLGGVIRRLYPGGVEFKQLWEVTIWDKKFNSVDKTKQPKVNSYPYLLASELFALQQEDGDVFLLSTGEQTGWTNSELAGENLCEGEIVTIPWGKSRAVTDCIKYYKGKFVTSDNRIATSNNTDILSNKFLYYWMMSKGTEIDGFYRGSGIKHPSMKDVLNMNIPIPPLSIQEEIVEMLDEFSSLCEDISAGLPAEIAAVRKQYEYYRDLLLTFPEENISA